MAWHMRDTRALVRKTGLWFLAFLLSLWGHVLAVYLEGGNKIAGCILIVMAASALVSVAVTLLSLFLEPLYSLSRQSYAKFKKRLDIATVFTRVVLMIQFLTAAGLSTVDEVRFNLVMSIALMTISVAALILTATIFYLTVQLEKKLVYLAAQAGGGSAVYREARSAASYRIRLLQWLVSYIAATLGCTLFPLPIVYWAIGSIPYQFVFWALIMSSPLVMIPIVAKFLKGKVKENFETMASTTVHIDALNSSVPF